MHISPPDDAAWYNIRRFGAVGDGTTLDTAAIQEAVDRCHEAGGGIVAAPPGTYLTGTIHLKSGVNLHLMAGATLLGSSRREDYNEDSIFPENPVFSIVDMTGAHLVVAYRAENVGISGDGVIDGNGPAFFEPIPADEMTDTYQRRTRAFPIRDWRPGQMVFFCCCSNVSVRDVSLINAPSFTVYFVGCRGVQVRGLRVANPPQTPNGDGIGIDCSRDVTVSDCIVHTGDDAITLKAGESFRHLDSEFLADNGLRCENVTVTNCVLSSATCGFRIGCGDGVVRDCAISNIVLKDTRTGINLISAWLESYAHGAIIENLQFSNLIMDTVVPINILLGEHARPPAAIRNVSFSHLRALGRQGCYIGGNAGYPLSGIHLHDVDLRMTGADVDPQFADRVPLPYGTNDVAAGLYARHVDGLRVSRLRVEWHEASGPWQGGLILEDSVTATLAGVEAPSPDW